MDLIQDCCKVMLEKRKIKEDGASFKVFGLKVFGAWPIFLSILVSSS